MTDKVRKQHGNGGEETHLDGMYNEKDSATVYKHSSILLWKLEEWGPEDMLVFLGLKERKAQEVRQKSIKVLFHISDRTRTA